VTKKSTSRVSPWVVAFLVFVVIGGPIFQLINSMLTEKRLPSAGAK
jgi:hypothetical protein